jgi:hypothetical protein
MDNKDKTFDLNEVLRWCLQVQGERIRRGLWYEMASPKLSPDLHRELLAFAKIAHLAAIDSQRASSQPVEARSPAETTTQTEVRQEIRDLDPEDRHLLREVVTILTELEKNQETQKSFDLRSNANEQKRPSAE